MPLQDIPQKFFSMQFWQMENPHRHLQQNGGCLPQQAQGISFAIRRFSLYEDRMGRLCIESLWSPGLPHRMLNDVGCSGIN
jgi:hypothetical protein